MLSRTRTPFWRLLLAFVFRGLKPGRLRRWIAQFLGTAGYLLFRRPARAVVSNLIPIVASRRRATLLARRTFVNFCVYTTDYVRFANLDPADIDALVTQAEGRENLLGVLARGAGGILVTPHLGHLELGGICLAMKQFPMTVVSLRDEDPRTDALRHELRRRHGIRTISYNPDDPSSNSILEMREVLRKNGLLAILTDRPTAQRCETVSFFEKEARFPIGPFVLSWVSRASIIPCMCVLHLENGYRLLMDPPITLDRSLPRDESIKQGVIKMARRFEKYIRAYPDQWYNFFPYWTSAPKDEGRK